VTRVPAATDVRGVILDFGGVMSNMRWEVARQLEDRHGLPRRAMFETLYRTPVWEAIQRGQGDRQAWLEDAHRLLEARARRALPRLHEVWRAAQDLIGENIALVRALRPVYRTAILSNADASLRERLRDAHGIHDLFDSILCSAEVGMAKPEPAIYRLAASRLALEPEACVFVDDLAANVTAAETVGMQGILFRVDRGDSLTALLAERGIRAPG